MGDLGFAHPPQPAAGAGYEQSLGTSGPSHHPGVEKGGWRRVTGGGQQPASPGAKERPSQGSPFPTRSSGAPTLVSSVAGVDLVVLPTRSSAMAPGPWVPSAHRPRRGVTSSQW